MFKEIKPEDIKENAFSLIGKDWMLITAEKEGEVNTMTAAWGGFGVMWHENVVFVVIRPQRFTKEFIDFNERFSLSFLPSKYKKQLTYLGTVSGKAENKIKKSGLTLEKENGIPYFKESKVVIFCKKLYVQDFCADNFLDKQLMDKCYPDKDYHTMYIAKVEKVFEKKP